MRSFGIALLAVLLVSMPAMLLAQSATSKLHGKVTDAESGEALIGATVILVATQAGASTDINGEYTILNIPPGTYDVKVAYVGYTQQLLKQVRVVAGVTTELNAKLTPSAIEVGEMVITVERPMFEAKSTNTVKVYDSKEIAQLPVRGVQKVVSVQSGVVTAEGDGGVAGNATLNVRGGRGTEVLYIVDGVAQNDILTGDAEAQVSDNAIEQIAFQVGGYEAKYGQAQSGIVNITTRSGSANYTAFIEGVTSSWTDDFGYNLYSANVSGPIIPGDGANTAFLSFERGWFKDAYPNAIGLDFQTRSEPDVNGEYLRADGATTPFASDYLPDNDADIWRFTGRTFHNLDFMTLRLGANYNTRNDRTYIHTYAKNNSHHNPRVELVNQSYSARIGKDFSPKTFLNATIGWKRYDRETGDGVWFDNFLAYGDTALNPEIVQQGSRINQDNVGIFFGKGRVSNAYTKTQNSAWTFDAEFSAQVDQNLLEVGGGMSFHEIRYLTFAPVGLAAVPTTPLLERFVGLNPIGYGYWLSETGTVRETSKGEKEPVNQADVEPRSPLVAYGYVQDRFELEDLVINVGVRFDYLDSKADKLRNESLPFGSGDPAVFDAADFVQAESEFYISPRIGLGFPITSTTVFHAQWGRFIQNPNLVDLYTAYYDLNALVTDDNLPVNTGWLGPEKTTQYEVGFRQILAENVAALNVTAFYKNTEDLTNQTTRVFYKQEGGGQYRYYGPSNYDFGTVMGLALSLDIRRLSYFSASVNYTLSKAEGTGSSTNSSFVATFRNTNGEVPQVIAPLDFDQRHTGSIVLGFNTGPNQLGWLENTSVNVLFSFNSGRPYTPLVSQNLLAGNTNYGDTKGYVNSAYGPGSSLLNLRVERTFLMSSVAITPYVFVENLLNTENAVNVYRSTGDPYSTAWINSAEGQAAANASPAGPDAYKADHKVYEADPVNFGVPRQIRLGLKVNFQ